MKEYYVIEPNNNKCYYVDAKSMNVMENGALVFKNGRRIIDAWAPGTWETAGINKREEIPPPTPTAHG